MIPKVESRTVWSSAKSRGSPCRSGAEREGGERRRDAVKHQHAGHHEEREEQTDVEGGRPAAPSASRGAASKQCDTRRPTRSAPSTNRGPSRSRSGFANEPAATALRRHSTCPVGRCRLPRARARDGGVGAVKGLGASGPGNVGTGDGRQPLEPGRQHRQRPVPEGDVRGTTPGARPPREADQAPVPAEDRDVWSELRDEARQDCDGRGREWRRWRWLVERPTPRCGPWR